MRHEVQVEGQFRRRQLLEERQDETAVRGRDEVVGVLYARGDPLEIGERADGVALQPSRQFLGGDARKDGHDSGAAAMSSARGASESADHPERDPHAAVEGLVSQSCAVAQILDQPVLEAGRRDDSHYTPAVDDLLFHLVAATGADAHRGLIRLIDGYPGRRRYGLRQRIEPGRLLRSERQGDGEQGGGENSARHKAEEPREGASLATVTHYVRILPEISSHIISLGKNAA